MPRLLVSKEAITTIIITTVRARIKVNPVELERILGLGLALAPQLERTLLLMARAQFLGKKNSTARVHLQDRQVVMQDLVGMGVAELQAIIPSRNGDTQRVVLAVGLQQDSVLVQLLLVSKESIATMSIELTTSPTTHPTDLAVTMLVEWSIQATGSTLTSQAFQACQARTIRGWVIVRLGAIRVPPARVSKVAQLRDLADLKFQGCREVDKVRLGTINMVKTTVTLQLTMFRDQEVMAMVPESMRAQAKIPLTMSLARETFRGFRGMAKEI